MFHLGENMTHQHGSYANKNKSMKDDRKLSGEDIKS
jgi:hypothetical protein